MKQTTKPTISILLPVYNAGKFLRVALNSILKQTYSNFELIIVNDASTDDSLSILKTFANKDARIRLFTNTTNQGISYSLNRALRYAKADFIARMDADDIMFPDRLEKQLSYLQLHPYVVVVGGQCQVINYRGRVTGQKLFPVRHEDIYQLAFNRAPLQHPAIMVNRALLPKNFSWYQTNYIPAEDLELFFRLFKYGRFANLPDFVLKYRRHKHNTSLINPFKTYQMAQKIRSLAVSRYSYTPNLHARILNLVQKLIVSFMPKHLIYPLYLLATGNFKLKLKKPTTPKALALAK